MWDTREDLVDFRKNPVVVRGDAPGKPDRDARHLPSARVHPAASCPWRPRGHICRRDPALANRSSLLPHCPCPATGRAPSGALAGCGWPGVPVLLHGAWLADFLYVCILLEVSPRPVSPDSLPPPRPSELPLRTSHPLPGLTLRGSRTSTLCLCCFVSQSPHVTLSRVGVSHVRLTLRTQ